MSDTEGEGGPPPEEVQAEDAPPPDETSPPETLQAEEPASEPSEAKAEHPPPEEETPAAKEVTPFPGKEAPTPVEEALTPEPEIPIPEPVAPVPVSEGVEVPKPYSEGADASATSKSGIKKERHPSQKQIRRLSLDRRLSGAMKGIGSTASASFRKHSGVEFDRFRGTRYMNTYRMESKNPFNVDRVLDIIKTVMLNELQDLRYDASVCPKLCVKISTELRYRVRLLAFDRYRIVCRVEIGEKTKEGVSSALRFLWDSERDNFASFTFENLYLFAVGIVCGIYLD